MSDEHREVVVLETSDPTELRLARNLFEQAGIPFRVDDAGSSALLGTVFGAQFAGPSTFVVPLECEARALEVLSAAWPESPPVGETE